jgi:hypothetical protein
MIEFSPIPGVSSLDLAIGFSLENSHLNEKVEVSLLEYSHLNEKVEVSLLE